VSLSDQVRGAEPARRESALTFGHGVSRFRTMGRGRKDGCEAAHLANRGGTSTSGSGQGPIRPIEGPTALRTGNPAEQRWKISSEDEMQIVTTCPTP
jgi:hypothetical protein